MRKIYVASSWRNSIQPKVVKALRAEGHEVYDFRNPTVGNKGFAWSAIDKDWMKWTPQQYVLHRNKSDRGGRLQTGQGRAQLVRHLRARITVRS